MLSKYIKYAFSIYSKYSRCEYLKFIHDRCQDIFVRNCKYNIYPTFWTFGRKYILYMINIFSYILHENNKNKNTIYKYTTFFQEIYLDETGIYVKCVSNIFRRIHFVFTRNIYFNYTTFRRKYILYIFHIFYYVFTCGVFWVYHFLWGWRRLLTYQLR